jgi:M6 family metalloprotease-like protein
VIALFSSGAGATEETGRLIMIAEGDGKEERLVPLLETVASKLLTLKVTPSQLKRLSRLPANASISVAGRPEAESFTLTDFTILDAESGVLNQGSAQTAHYAPALGERKVAVLMVNFQDSTGEPGTVAQAQAVFDGPINDYFAEASYNRVYLTTDVFGWWTLPYDASRCFDPDLYLVSSEIKEEAARRGVDLRPYDHLVYVFSESFGHWCSAASGTVSPGSQGIVWRVWNSDTGLAELAFDGTKGIEDSIHELGHNLGLWHANLWDCGEQVVAEDCTVVAYGDFYDAMGSGPIGPHFNAFHKERLGWIQPAHGSPQQILNVDTSGIYAISPLGSDGGVMALRIRRGAGAEGGVDYLYVEFRQALGWDNGFDANVYEGVLVHLGNDTIADSSRLLNMTPLNPWEHVLRPGLPFHDPVSDVTMELISVSPSEAFVHIVVGVDQSPPMVELISPMDSELVDKGSRLDIIARATDNKGLSSIEFSVDGNVICSLNSAPLASGEYDCYFDVPKGKDRTLAIEVRSIDMANNVTSASVLIFTGDPNGRKKGGKK